ncbi:MAG: poly-beta-1,6-N-acetyl-D-glucosamine N-deacetylase PgaB [Steroidobacteraceae bacterium]
MLRTVLLLLGLGLASSFAQGRVEFQPRPLVVLAYHEIAAPTEALVPDYAVTPTAFVRHIDWLRNTGFTFVSVEEVIAAREGRATLPARAVLLTFDDGYASFYQHAWPMLKMLRIPAVVSVVTSWHEGVGAVNLDGRSVSRERFMSWEQLREIQASGLVELASHTHDLHHGVPGNPQGSRMAAATTRRFDAASQRYESQADYASRIAADLRQSKRVLQRRTGREPRVWTWPYGRYNETVQQKAVALGMQVGLTLEDGANVAETSPLRLRRILIQSNTDIGELRYQIRLRDERVSENDRPQKIAHIDLDYLHDPNPEQLRRNVDHLVDRLTWLGVNVVYLQAFSDPDANGSAAAVYFPNRHIPVTADLFSYVAWEIRTRTPVRRVYAWMPLLAWELPPAHPAHAQLVRAEAGPVRGSVNMGYHRLSPFSALARETILEIYEDLARHCSVEGVIFHDDITLSDLEDASDMALATYREWGLPGSVREIAANDELLGRWTILKINALDELAAQAATVMRRDAPALFTARNLYAQVALNPRAEVWYSQALENSLRRYDFTAIMAMPYMEGAADPLRFQLDLVDSLRRFPGALRKTIFELQSVDWKRAQAPIPSEEMARTIGLLYDNGVIHVGYYPDMLFQSHPDPAVIRRALSGRSSDPLLLEP